MSVELTRVSILIGADVVAAVVATGLGIWALSSRRDHPLRVVFAVFVFAIALWSVGNAGRILSPTMAAKYPWNVLGYAGRVLLPPTWLVVVLYYVGRDRWVTQRLVAALVVPSVLMLALVVTDGYHHLVYPDARLVPVENVLALESDETLIYWGLVGAMYAQLVVATVLMVTFAARTWDTYRRQSAYLLVGVGFPWLVHALSLADVVYPVLNPTPAAFGVGSLFIAGAIHRAHFIDVLPVARDQILDTVDDAIVVLDRAGRVVDINRAAADLLVPDRATVIGCPAAAVLPRPLVDAGVLAGRTDADFECRIAPPTGPKWYWIRRRRSEHARRSGTMLVMTDVTTQTRQQALLDRQNERFREIASTVSHDVRNPLNKMSGYLELLRTELAGDALDVDAMAAHVDATQRATDQLVDATDDLLSATSGVGDEDVGAIDLFAETAWSLFDPADADLVVETSRLFRCDVGALQELFEAAFRAVFDAVPDATTVRIGETAAGFYVAGEGGRALDAAAAGTDDRRRPDGEVALREAVRSCGWTFERTLPPEGGVRFDVRTATASSTGGASHSDAGGPAGEVDQ